MESIKDKKRAIRKRMGQLNRSFSETYFNSKDAEIKRIILRKTEVFGAKTILSYWSMPREAGTHKLNQELNDLGKTVLLPVIQDNELVLKAFTGLENMETEPKYGILEPKGKEFNDFHLIDIVLVPGVAFTLSGLRCGHGKGFYDRLLPKLKSATTIGLCYEHQMLENLPTDHFDVILNQVLFA